MNHGDGECLGMRVLEIIRGFGRALGDFGESSWRQGFALDWTISGSMGNLVIEYLNKSYLIGGKTRVGKAAIGKVAAVTHIAQTGEHLVIFVVWKYLYFCLCSDKIKKRSYFILFFLP